MTARTGEPAKEGEDRICWLQAVHPGAALDDGARGFATGDVRRLLAARQAGPASSADLGVAGVETGGLDRQQHLTFARWARLRPIVPDLDDLGRTMSRNDRGTHQASMPDGHRNRRRARWRSGPR